MVNEIYIACIRCIDSHPGFHDFIILTPINKKKTQLIVCYDSMPKIDNGYIDYILVLFSDHWLAIKYQSWISLISLCIITACDLEKNPHKSYL